ncbi:hypothetical protein E5K00_13480 [Hymenobacter aquaticus]|uniref:Uncharacterized protein n=1 Tax=Hymenobacter aquaticus TaxID=1867101 RepID=A0A4Z0PU85_9BACT|nr:hypothetical protein [Hymenobacter aquaticus]TGE21298.1 hypothetical protein E5K00_13480 [Hymenobacter aquaticus]
MIRPVLALFLSVLMLVSSLVPQNDVEELGKLPQLVQHFRSHAAQARGQLSVSQFLGLHYGAASTRHDQYVRAVRHSQEHDNLPLRGQHNFPNLDYIVPAGRVAVLACRRVRSSAAYRAPARSLYAFALANSLLQPPRV